MTYPISEWQVVDDELRKSSPKDDALREAILAGQTVFVPCKDVTADKLANRLRNRYVRVGGVTTSHRVIDGVDGVLVWKKADA